MIAATLKVMVQRWYLEVGHVVNTVHYFAVPSGENDIRVV